MPFTRIPWMLIILFWKTWKWKLLWDGKMCHEEWTVDSPVPVWISEGFLANKCEEIDG